jgi:hypothetical protein
LRAAFDCCRAVVFFPAPAALCGVLAVFSAAGRFSGFRAGPFRAGFAADFFAGAFLAAGFLPAGREPAFFAGAFLLPFAPAFFATFFIPPLPALPANDAAADRTPPSTLRGFFPALLGLREPLFAPAFAPDAFPTPAPLARLPAGRFAADRTAPTRVPPARRRRPSPGSARPAIDSGRSAMLSS